MRSAPELFGTSTAFPAAATSLEKCDHQLMQFAGSEELAAPRAPGQPARLRWYVHSERTLLTHAFGSRLAGDEDPALHARHIAGAGHFWRAATTERSIEIAQVECRFGAEAAQRARLDAKSVVVVVTREQQR